MTAAQTVQKNSSTTRSDLTMALAEKAAGLRYDQISEAARTVAGHCLLDWFGVTLAAWNEPLAQILAADIADEGGAAQATVVGRGTQGAGAAGGAAERRDVACARLRRRQFRDGRAPDGADRRSGAAACRICKARRQASDRGVRRGLRDRMPDRPLHGAVALRRRAGTTPRPTVRSALRPRRATCCGSMRRRRRWRWGSPRRRRPA